MPDIQPLSQEYHVFDPERREITVVVVHQTKRRYWLHALLFLATIFTTLCIGAHMQDTFNRNLGLFSDDRVTTKAAGPRGPAGIGAVPLDVTGATPTPGNAIERAKGLESTLQQQSQDMGQRIDAQTK